MLMQLLRLFTALTGAFATAATAQIVAVDYPPLMIEGADPPGWAIEIVREAEARIGVSSEIQFLPFPRAIKSVQRRSGIIHPALYRNPQREDKYTWIARVHVVNNVFLTTGEPIDSLEDARRLGRIGVENETAMDEFLTAQRFDNLERAERAELNARKLAAGRVDAWFLTDTLAQWAWKQAGLEQPLVMGMPISSSDVYIVGGTDFPPDRAAAYRAAIESMHADGMIDGVLGKYR